LKEWDYKMAIRRQKYGRELERQLRIGKDIAEAHKIAAKKAQQRKKKEESLQAKVARKLRELYYGEKAYAKRRFPPTGRRR